MIFTDYRFLLDVHEFNSQISLSFKQGDTGRVMYMTLTENGDIFDIPQDCVAVFTALKPDGNIIFNDCEINGNEISYSTTAQTTTVSGKVDCELRLYGAGNTLITSPHFTIFVHPTVYADQIESMSEVNTLTRLISESTALMESVNEKLENGDFVPKISIGTVETLPAGSMATASFTGTGEAPVLNLGIPQGDEGQAESLIPDAELSTTSTKPVQNKVIYEAFAERDEDIAALEQAINSSASTLNKSITANAQAISNTNSAVSSLTQRVAKHETDTTAAFTQVNQAIGAANAAIAAMPDTIAEYMAEHPLSGDQIGPGSVNTTQLANDSVTGDKLADDVVAKNFTATIGTTWTGSAAPYTQEISVAGLPASARIIADIVLSDSWETAEIENKEFGKIRRIKAEAGKLTVYAAKPTTTALSIKLMVMHD